MTRRRPAVVILGVALALALSGSKARSQQQPTALAPQEPKDDASVGKKPRFLLKAVSEDVEKLQFRIELSTDGFKTIAYMFDQTQDPNGWAYTVLEDGSPGAAYFTRRPLEAGDYEWRVASWDGLAWLAPAGRFRLRIDDVPPAEVTGVLMSRDLRTGCVWINWPPVTVDRDGRSERVALYHVYRYASKRLNQPIRPYEAGETAALEYEDCDEEALKKPILFYRVVAEDEAGNITGRNY